MIEWNKTEYNIKLAAFREATSNFNNGIENVNSDCQLKDLKKYIELYYEIAKFLLEYKEFLNLDIAKLQDASDELFIVESNLIK